MDQASRVIIEIVNNIALLEFNESKSNKYVSNKIGWK